MSEDKAENLHPDKSTVASGTAIASIISKALLHPIDTVKCRIQAFQWADGFRSFRLHWGGQWSLAFLYSGCPVKLLLYVPYQICYMTMYFHVRGEGTVSYSRVVAAAVSAELAGACFRVPMEVAKIRLQSSLYQGSVHAFKSVMSLRTYRMLVPLTLLHDIPYSITQWTCYETLSWQSKMEHSDPTISRIVTSLPSFLRGGLSGVFAAVCTCPLDVIKTRCVVESNVGVIRRARQLYHHEGIACFFRGCSARSFWVGSNMALYFYLLKLLAVIH